jgi:hypothetical protein
MIHNHTSAMQKQGISGYQENKKIEEKFLEDRSQASLEPIKEDLKGEG